MKLDQSLCTNILDGLWEGVYLVDRDGRILYWNKGAEHISGYTRSEMVGNLCRDCGLKHLDDEGCSICEERCQLEACIASRREHESDLFLRHKDGHRVPVAVKTKPLIGEDGEPFGAMEIFRVRYSQTAMLQRIEQLERLALLDPLTRLPNRRAIEASLHMRIEELSRYDWPFGIMFVDIDHFKAVNDKHGHDMGDKVLVLVSRTLLHSLRPFDTLGRWGGEEFVGIVVNVELDDMYDIAERARRLVEQSKLFFEDGEINVSVSIGATMARQGETIEDLVKRADELMYQSKLAGRNKVSTGR